MRYNADHRERTRTRVLAEAARMLRVDGPHRLGVADVMSRAGLTHGGFYQHFRSKEDLVAAALNVAFDEAKATFDRAVGEREPRAALAAYIESYLSLAHRNGPDRGCPLPALAADVPRMSEDLRIRYVAGMRRLAARLRSLLEAAGVAEAEMQAASVTSELVGAISLARALSDEQEAALLLRQSREALTARLGLKALS